MHKKYWVLIILIVAAGLVSWYYFANKHAQPCFNETILLKEIKDFPKPVNGKCPAGYFINSLLCPNSTIWCQPDKKFTATATPLTSVASTTIGNIKDWKIYINNQYGFELKYPSNWFMESYGTDGPWTLQSAKFEDNIHGLGIPTSGNMWISLNLLNKDITCVPQNYEYSGYSVEFEYLPPAQGPDHIDAGTLRKTFCKNNLQITLELWADDKNAETHKILLDQILSTFKFTK